MSDGTKVRQNIGETKENLENLSKSYTGVKKSRGFIKDLNVALGNGESGAQSHYFDVTFPDGHIIVLRTSNHNAHAETFKPGDDAISVVIKSARRKNTFQESEGVSLVGYVYFKEDIKYSDGNTLSQIAESIKDLLDTGVFVDKSGLAKVNPKEEFKFSLREKPVPKNTGIGYKVFYLKNGKLYPPMVANPDGAETPVGVWLDADAAPVVEVSKTGRPKVKQGGKGTQGGSGTLAYRPGWLLGEIPYALQFNRKNPETGERELFPNNFVWAEVDYATHLKNT